MVEAEYFAIRNQATLFDLSAMRKFRVRGPDALRVMNRLVTRDLARLRPGRVAYALWCDEDGMVIDDGTVFRLGEQDFRLCCQEPQYGWLMDVAWGFDVAIEDESETVAGLSLQGPTAFAVLEAGGIRGRRSPEALRPGRDRRHPDLANRLHRRSRLRALGPAWGRAGLVGPAVGRGPAARPAAIGYAALDLARLEAGFILSGRDYVSIHHAARPTRGRTPFELGYGALVDFEKGHFNGRRALLRHADKGPRYMLVALDVDGGKPAHDALVYHRRKTEVGHVTSAAWSPTCKRNLALAMLKAPYGVTTTSDLWVEIYRDKEGKWERIMAAARIVERPFFRHPRRSATPPGKF